MVVRGGRIARVAAWGEIPDEAELIDFGDAVLLPGLVDSHVHVNDAVPGPDGLSRSDWEGFSTATRAAAAGGVTTLVDMPLNCVPETTNVDALVAKFDADPSKLVSYGLNISQVEQQLSNNNSNAGGSFVGHNAPGSARLVLDEDRQVLVGATFTGVDVAEFLHAATIAVVGEVPVDRLRHAVPSFPTRSEVWLDLLQALG